ncbi:chloride channel protein [Halomarina pelagica]|uniref:chloride channel protein n=1 Tax=Halomarina pelagica TaxID=2961599 RepID=UPI0020C257CA|nr:chloride channel protein [Halomarina sp. BND7]
MAATTLPNAERGSRDSPDDFRLGYVSVLAGVIGVAAAIIAYLIYHFIGFLYNLFFYQRIGFEFVEPTGSAGSVLVAADGTVNSLLFPPSGPPLWIVLVPAFGGLIAGLMAQYGSRRIIGHGIPEAMEAVWSNDSKVEPRILILKPISAAIAIGTGAPFGVEGPIIQSGGAMGSVFGQWISTTVAERKVLLACGAAAGMAATFNTPLAGILVAIELLVFEFRARSFVPISIASVIATGARRPLIGTGPMFHMGDVPIDLFSNLPFLVVLGIIIGGVAIIFKDGYFWAEEYIHRIPVNDVLLPAIGGLILGVMGLLVPRTFGVGYGVAEEILNNELAVGVVFLVMVFKVVGVYVTLGSKTSGGFLAPVFVAGAAIGSVFAHSVNALVPGVTIPVALFALAGLGTLFGVVSNATFGFTLFAIEVTGQYEAILPVFLVGVVADAVATLYMGSDLMTAELSDRGIDVHQDYEIDVLKRFNAGEVMDEKPAVINPGVTVAQLAATVAETDDSTSRSPIANGGFEAAIDESESIADAEPIDLAPNDERTIHDGFPIVDSDGALTGVITYGDLVRAIARDQEDRTVGELGTSELIVGYPDERLFDTVVRMAENDIEQLPIVSRADETELVGWLDSQHLMTSALRQLDEERVREEGRLSGYINLLTAKRRSS